MNNKTRGSHIRAFLRYYRPHARLFSLDMACAFLIAVIDLAFPFVSRLILNDYIPNRNYDVFYLLVLLVLLTFLLRTGMTFIVTYLGHTMGVRMEADMRNEVFTHLQKLSFTFYDKTRTGHLMSRVVSDLFEITELAHHGPEDIIISLFTLLGAFVFMMQIDRRLALPVCLLMPVMAWYAVHARKKMMRASKRVKEETAGISAGIESSISGIRVAKAFSNEDHERRRFSHDNELYKRARIKFYRHLGEFMSGVDFFMALPNLMVIAAGGIMVMNGTMELSVLIVFTLYVNTFLSPMKRLTAFVEQYSLGMSGFERFSELMETEPDIRDAPHAAALKSVRGDVEYKNVAFAYDKEKNVLAHVSFAVAAGSTLALVGPSGGGKSTLCHLLPRFYEATEGEILIDGQNIKSITMASLRANIGIVQQDVFLFADTIRENIRYGRLNATEEEVVEAAKLAEMHEEILALPNGYDTFVGERGVMLSGGQKQRISIARLFLKNPPILILDEATSALDTYTEHRIQAAFDKLSKDRTTFVIAHRLSTVYQADEIIVIDEEGIKERGTHEELLALGGEYASLYHAQFDGE